MTKPVLARFLPVFCLLAIGLMTCGKTDARDDVRNQFGEPTDILTQGADPFWRETWFYCDIGLEFQFRRTSGWP